MQWSSKPNRYNHPIASSSALAVHALVSALGALPIGRNEGVAMTSRRVLRTAGIGMLFGIATSAVTISCAGMAAADRSSTQGEIRGPNSVSTSGHAIVSDACSRVGKGCLPSSISPNMIAASTGTSNDPDSILDGDGFQADAVDRDGFQADAVDGDGYQADDIRYPLITATPGLRAFRPRGF